MKLLAIFEEDECQYCVMPSFQVKYGKFDIYKNNIQNFAQQKRQSECNIKFKLPYLFVSA